MNIFIIGATGMAGRAITAEALRRGHQVIAAARDTGKIAPAPGLTAETLDVTENPARLAELSRDADVIVGAVSPRGTDDVAGKAAAYVDALLQNGSDVRVIVVGGAGTLNLPDGTPVADLVPPDIAPEAKAMRAGYEKLAGSDLDFSYLAPAAEFFEGEATGSFRLGGRELMSDAEGRSRISTGDYASALLDEIETPRHRRGLFSVAY